MINKTSLENLKPFEKGQSGNPKGRPKKLPDLDKLLGEVMGEDEEGNSEAKAIIENLIKIAKANKGSVSVRAGEVLLERGYGKAKQPVDMKGDIVHRMIIEDQSGNDPINGNEIESAGNAGLSGE